MISICHTGHHTSKLKLELKADALSAAKKQEQVELVTYNNPNNDR